MGNEISFCDCKNRNLLSEAKFNCCETYFSNKTNYITSRKENNNIYVQTKKNHLILVRFPNVHHNQ
jgi:hypothetical protein